MSAVEPPLASPTGLAVAVVVTRDKPLLPPCSKLMPIPLSSVLALPVSECPLPGAHSEAEFGVGYEGGKRSSLFSEVCWGPG